MRSIKIAGKEFKLASRMKRLYAFFIDVALIGAVQSVFGFLFALVAILFFDTGFSNMLKASVTFSVYALISAALWAFGLFFMDGFRNGQGIGKNYCLYRSSDSKIVNFAPSKMRSFVDLQVSFNR